MTTVTVVTVVAVVKVVTVVTIERNKHVCMTYHKFASVIGIIKDLVGLASVRCQPFWVYFGISVSIRIHQNIQCLPCLGLFKESLSLKT